MTWQVVVDRLEGELAVLLVGEEEWQLEVPIAQLPAGVTEGCHLAAKWTIDHESTEAARDRVAGLLERLQSRNQEQD